MTCPSCAHAAIDPHSGDYTVTCIDCACRMIETAGTKTLRLKAIEYLTRHQFSRDQLVERIDQRRKTSLKT